MREPSPGPRARLSQWAQWESEGKSAGRTFVGESGDKSRDKLPHIENRPANVGRRGASLTAGQPPCPGPQMGDWAAWALDATDSGRDSSHWWSRNLLPGS